MHFLKCSGRSEPLEIQCLIFYSSYFELSLELDTLNSVSHHYRGLIQVLDLLPRNYPATGATYLINRMSARLPVIQEPMSLEAHPSVDGESCLAVCICKNQYLLFMQY